MSDGTMHPASAGVAARPAGTPVGASDRAERRLAELWVLHQIGEALQSATDGGRILRIILVGATARQGLAFNRAFLLLEDGDRNELVGAAGIGPGSPDEARAIWDALSRADVDLKELLRKIEPYLPNCDERVAEIARNLSVRLDGDGFLARAFHSRRGVVVDRGRIRGEDREVEPDLLAWLGTDSLAAVPLVADERPLGLLLADNAVTGKPIADDDVRALELLAVQAAVAIERARLTDELAEHAAALEHANREIQDAQRRLLRAERLSSIGQMAARLAHEIRNPLTVIGAYARSLERRASCDERTHEVLGIIADEVSRLEHIVGRVLDFARDPGSRREPVALAEVAREGFRLMEWELDRAGIEPALDTGDGPFEVEGDRDQLLQVLINLMHNSIQAMPHGGRLTVRLDREADTTELTVTDDGCGIPEEVRERIFEPFFTTRSSGTGLGLAIVSSIVRNHGGELFIESSPGAGTAVRVRLPVTNPAAPRDAPSRRNDPCPRS